jgi:predicted Zn-ribbon and HTH transcriptional regulator
MSHDMITVYRAESVDEANVVAMWLNAQGITAFVKDQTMAGTFDFAALSTPLGIEVYVTDSDQAAQAVEALKEHYKKQAEAEAIGPPIEATCEECGQTSSFPYSQRGLVQRCPHCKAYMDVPDPDSVPDAGDALDAGDVPDA